MSVANAGKILAVATVLALAALLGSAAGAAADVNFCSSGSGAGQCSSPEGLAADFQTDRLYVADKGNNRVDVFEADEAEGEVKFLFAFGWGVDTGAEVLETCTTASGCQQGLNRAGAGALAGPARIAVDNDSTSPNFHHVFVTDFSKARLSHFDPEGNFVRASGWGVDTGAGEFEICTTASGCQAGIPTSESSGGPCQLTNRSDPVALGAGGVVSVARSRRVGFANGSNVFENRIEHFAPNGECEGEIPLEDANTHGMEWLALDPSGAIFLALTVDQGVTKYGPGGEGALCRGDTHVEEAEGPGIFTTGLGFDAAGRLFAGQSEKTISGSPAHRVFTEYETECDGEEALPVLQRVGYSRLPGTNSGLAALHTILGDVFGAQSTSSGVISYLDVDTPPPGPVVVPDLGITPHSVSAEIEAEINPEGEQTTARVDFVKKSICEEDEAAEGPEHCFDQAVEGEPTVLEGEGFRVKGTGIIAGCRPFSEEALKEGKCLEPETEFRFQAIATNADNPQGEGAARTEGTFTTLGPLQIEQAYPTAVDPEEATLNAVLNPLGSEATGYFEYVDQASFEASGWAGAKQLPDLEAGAEPLDFGASEEPTRRSALLSGLDPGERYRFRVRASDPFVEDALGPEATFKTPRVITPTACPNDAFRIGPGELLPDCRAYELVSPLDKAGGDVVDLGLPAPSQAATSGKRMSYGSYRAFGDAKGAPYGSEYLAERTGSGWQSHGVGPGLGPRVGTGAPLIQEFYSFSADLCRAWAVLEFDADPPLDAAAAPRQRNLYQREDRLCNGGEDAFRTLSPGAAERLGTSFSAAPQGHSADGAVTAFATNDNLVEGTGAPAQPGECTASTVVKCRSRVYVAEPGIAPRYACVRAGGVASPGPCSAGTNNLTVGFFNRTHSANLQGALSADGKRLYWTDGELEGRVYLRENPLGPGGECANAITPCTRNVSKQGEEESGTSASHFWTAAEDGSAAYYSAGEDLYRYSREAEASTKVAGGFLGFLGAGTDAARAYFVASEAIPGSGENSEGEEAQAGEPNLYLYEAEGEGLRFVAGLTDADVNTKPLGTSATAYGMDHHNGRVNPSGTAAAFMSEAPLTGFDNTDAASPLPCGEAGGICDNEVFVYDAEAEELICASCNPTGARPEGVSPAGGFWVAARMQGYQSGIYASRSLSADGRRLYFESQDPLVPRDTNGRLDVYQWERSGAGGCSAASPSYSEDSGGCIDLISSGQSVRDAEFLDASPDGENVFFATLASLYGADYGLVDVYDARAGGGFPPPSAPAPECEGESCQSPPPAPAASAPASAAYSGPGNLAEAASPAARCNRAARRARSLARRAKVLRRRASGTRVPDMRRKSIRAARRARALSRNAKRCRARVRAARRNRP